jgi:hypothetical protein
MKKRIIVFILMLVFLGAISSTSLAAYNEYYGKCKWSFDTLTFDNYIEVQAGQSYQTHNFHNYKYSHTSGTPVMLTVAAKENYDDGAMSIHYNYEQSSGSYQPEDHAGQHAILHYGIINDYYTGSYMYTQGSYYSW